jgi:hypothetical protein
MSRFAKVATRRDFALIGGNLIHYLSLHIVSGSMNGGVNGTPCEQSCRTPVVILLVTLVVGIP